MSDTPFLHENPSIITKTYIQNNQGGKIAADHGVVKAKGSWVTVDTPALKIRVLPPTWMLMVMFVCLPRRLLGKFACIQDLFSMSLQTFLIAFHSRLQVKLSYGTALLFQCGTTCLCIYCTKKHQNKQPLLHAFPVLIQKICQPINNVFQRVSFPLLSFQSGSKSVNIRQSKNHLSLSKSRIWEFLFKLMYISPPTRSSDQCTKINKPSIENTTLI